MTTPSIAARRRAASKVLAASFVRLGNALGMNLGNAIAKDCEDSGEERDVRRDQSLRLPLLRAQPSQVQGRDLGNDRRAGERAMENCPVPVWERPIV